MLESLPLSLSIGASNWLFGRFCLILRLRWNLLLFLVLGFLHRVRLFRDWFISSVSSDSVNGPLVISFLLVNFLSINKIKLPCLLSVELVRCLISLRNISSSLSFGNSLSHFGRIPHLGLHSREALGSHFVGLNAVPSGIILRILINSDSHWISIILVKRLHF